MKRLYSFLAFLLGIQFLAMAQIPAGYYDAANGLSGQQLKTALFNTIKNPNVTSYSGLWTSFQTTDRDVYYENDASVMDIYSENPLSTDPYNFSYTADQCGTYSGEGGCYNREHSFPKSWFSSASPMYSDLHHIYPTDGKVNGMRSNYPYGPNNGEQYTSQNGSKLGACTAAGYTGTVFEPIDEFKGDLARTYFYMATCYEDKISGWNSVVLDGTNFKCYTTWFLDILLQWNAQDPVSQKEIDRNNAIYAIQGNRNPFIDHPEYVNQIWGGATTTPTVPAAPTNFVLNATTAQLELSWTDNSDETGYKLYRSTDNVNFSLLTSLAANTTSYADASVVGGTTYYYYLTAYNAQGESTASTTVNGQLNTTGGGTGASELFFSEYVEGSSYNKALEISNFTGSDVNLSGYVIKKQSNGSGSWSGGLALSGTLTNGQSFVIANSSASSSILNVADLTSNSSEMSFNGNDPVSLWKNGVLIDIIGVFNNTSYFGKDKTLIRNSSVSSPNTSYSVSEWTSKSKDYFSNLGTHTFDGGAPASDTQAPTAPANLTSSNITQTSVNLAWSASTDNVGVTAYDIYKNGSLLSSTTSLSYTVNSLVASTSYSFYVKAKDAAGNVSAASNTVNVTTQSAVVSYCTASGNNTNYEYINKVVLNTINKTSGDNNGYVDFTSLSTGLNAGSSYTISLYPGFVSYSYNEGWSVWIDFNHDGDFSDANENVYTHSATSANVSGTITIPSTVPAGNTRMRVKMEYNTTPTTYCGTFTYGEVEDYTVTISSAKSGNMAIKPQNNAENVGVNTSVVYPNPVKDILYVKYAEDVKLSVYNLQAKEVISNKSAQHGLDISFLKSGVYILRINNHGRISHERIIKQ